jgi:ERCC4-type nuclease
MEEVVKEVVSSEYSLYIDNREGKIIDVIEKPILKYEKIKGNKPINVHYENLDIGDIIIKLNNEPLIIIERKTISDFASSIKSTRYREQKFRLAASNVNKHHIIYLIEGKIPDEEMVNSLPYNTYWSAMTNTLIRDNMTVFRTRNVKETIIFMINLYDKAVKYKLQHDSSITNNNPTSYLSTMKVHQTKKENVTPKTCFIGQLSQIPGISTKIAELIANEYNSIYDLCLEYKRLTDEHMKAKEEEVNGKVEEVEEKKEEEKKKKRKKKKIEDSREILLTKINGIGNNKSKKVYEFLTNS